MLIDVLRGVPLATALLRSLREQGPVTVSIVSRMEVIRGCRSREDQARAERLLKQPELLEMNARVATRADALIARFYLSHSLGIADALIAATALEYDLLLVSKNQRDYRFLHQEAGLNLLPYPDT